MSANESSPAPAAGRLKFTEKLGYGLGDTASNFFFQSFNVFLLYYYTDVFGLAPAAVGTMFLVTRVLDAVSDPAMGLIADRTNTRWGKYRPYLLYMAIPYGLLGYAMFIGPDLSQGGKLVYAYITYSMMMLVYTAINIPYSALMGVISPSSHERVAVSSYRFVCAFAAGWVVVTFVTPLRTILGGGNEEEGFRLTMMIFAALSILLFWITFASTRERVQPIVEKSNVREDLAALMQNLPWIALFVSGVFSLMQIAIRSGALIFYLKYYVGDDGARVFLIFDLTAIFMSMGTIALILGVTMTGALTRRFEKRTLTIALNLVNAAIAGSFFFLPPDWFWVMVTLYCLGQFIAGPLAPLVFAMNADCADYGEWKTGRRSTGLVFSGSGFAAKMGLAVGAGLSGYLLALFGFVANEVQTESALLGIQLMVSLVPAVISLLSVAAILFYRLDRATVARIEVDLDQRRQETQPAS